MRMICTLGRSAPTRASVTEPLELVNASLAMMVLLANERFALRTATTVALAGLSVFWLLRLAVLTAMYGTPTRRLDASAILDIVDLPASCRSVLLEEILLMDMAMRPAVTALAEVFVITTVESATASVDSSAHDASIKQLSSKLSLSL